MTRTGTSKTVGDGFAIGRLRKAIAFHAAAKLINNFQSDIQDVDVLASIAVLAVIAYTDAITARIDSKVNQADHSAAAKLLRDVLGKELPTAQFNRLRNMLSSKDEVHYGARTGRADPEKTMADLDTYGAWAKEILRVKGLTEAEPPHG
jgi:hypothetical protein